MAKRPKVVQLQTNPPMGEVSTVSSYLYLTKPYPYNPDEVIGKKGIKKYTEMFRDEQIKAAVLGKQMAVISAGWEIKAPDREEDQEQEMADEMARFIEFNLAEMAGSFETKLIEMLSALVYGYSVAEKIFWMIDYGEFNGKFGLKDLKYRNPDGIEFETDSYGNLLRDGVLQANRRLPAEKFFIYSYRKKFSNYYGDSDLRECYRCYSDDTEILTESGWKNISLVSREERVATLDPASDKLHYRYPTETFSYRHKGKMFHQGGRFIDLLVTPNHKMWAKGESEASYSFKEPHELPKHVNYKRDAKWMGHEPETFILPEFSSSYMMSNQFVRNHTEHRYYRGAKAVPMEAWLSFFGVWLAEGYTWQRKNGTRQRVVGITQKRGPKLEQIKQWITACGFKYYEHSKGDIVNVEIFDAQLFSYLSQFGGSHTKFIPHELKQLSPRLLRVLYDAMMLGDGRHDHEYCTVSKRLADDVSEIVLKMGYAATVFQENWKRFGSSPIWIVSRNERRIDRTRCNEHKDQRQWVNYDGMVYCLEVNPHHLVYVRRNGKACWSGNSWWSKDCLIKFMMMTLERYGEPVWVFSTEGAITTTNRSVLESFMKDIQSKSGLILPSNITADPKFPAPDAGRHYITVLSYLDGLIRMALGMPSLIGLSGDEPRTGSYARAKTQFDVFFTLMEYLRRDVETNIDEQLIKPLIDYNYDVTDGKYPTFKFREMTQEMKDSQFEKYIAGLEKQALTKTREDEDYFRDLLGIPDLPDDIEDEKVEPPTEPEPEPENQTPNGPEDQDDSEPEEDEDVEELADSRSEHETYMAQRALEHHLVDKANGIGAAMSVKNYLAKPAIRYLRVPGIGQLHAEMKMDPSLDTDPEKYRQRRETVFLRQDQKRLSIAGLIPTSDAVDMALVEEISHDAEALNRQVFIVQDGADSYLIDGHARVCARTLANKKTVQARVFQVSNQPNPEKAKRAEFAQIKRELDATEFMASKVLKSVMRDTMEKTIGEIQALNGNISVAIVRNFSIETPNKLADTLGKMYSQAWDFGQDSIIRILPQSVKDDPRTVRAERKISGFAFTPEWLKEDKSGSWAAIAARYAEEKHFDLFEPAEAIAAFEARKWLIKDVIDDTLKRQVRFELFEHLKGGRTMRETIANIRDIFLPWVGDPSKIAPGAESILQAYRIENIIRTETTWAYNQGRLAMGEAAGDYVIGYEFSAILDDRTTEICNAADNLKIRKDDPLLPKLTPPLHYQCRSVLVPVTTDESPVRWSTQAKKDSAVRKIPTGFK